MAYNDEVCLDFLEEFGPSLLQVTDGARSWTTLTYYNGISKVYYACTGSVCNSFLHDTSLDPEPNVVPRAVRSALYSPSKPSFQIIKFISFRREARRKVSWTEPR
jgi:hypothetical protein